MFLLHSLEYNICYTLPCHYEWSRWNPECCSFLDFLFAYFFFHACEAQKIPIDDYRRLLRVCGDVQVIISNLPLDIASPWFQTHSALSYGICRKLQFVAVICLRVASATKIHSFYRPNLIKHDQGPRQQCLEVAVVAFATLDPNELQLPNVRF